MEQLLQVALAPANVFYTILLGFIMLYWLTVFLGALDLEFLDFDLDADHDLDLDGDIEGDADLDGGSGWGMNALSFFNVGQVPFMIFLSFLVLAMWVGSLLAYDAFGQDSEWFFLSWLLPNLLMGLLITKLASTPFKGLHRRLNEGGIQKRELVGKIGEVILTIRPDSLGRIELLVGEDTFVLDVLSADEASISVGQQALIVEYDQQADTYRAQRFEV
jgi:hypothetical protein